MKNAIHFSGVINILSVTLFSYSVICHWPLLLFCSLKDCKEHIIQFRVIFGPLGCLWLRWP